MLIVATDTHQLHHGVELSPRDGLIDSTESPLRADMIAAALDLEAIAGEPIDRALLLKVHSAEYIELLESAWERWQERPTAGPVALPFAWPSRRVRSVRPDDLVGQLGYHSFAADTSIGPGTWEAVSATAGVAMTAADHLAVGAHTGQRSAYALCRPPGHHATADQFGGYCYLNNAAIAVQRLLDRGAQRVTVLDVDYHHGNGTQAIFYERSDVLFVSLHADPRDEFPFFAGHADEIGAGDGVGWNLNVPLAAGTDFPAYVSALAQPLERIRESGSDALVVSLGVDTYVDDPLGTFALTTEDFGSLGGHVGALGLPTVIVQEGGYAVDDIGTNVARFLEGFESTHA